ncbi:alpha/beta-hydrolase [Aureobasidium subglaciale]|nr:alpha/beta-hydrolase [Aureobasidium subglaciale]
MATTQVTDSTTTKLHAFSRQDTAYTSDGFSIGISVFVPKSAGKGQNLPVHVRWHGGALINGGRVYEPWFPKWTIDLAALHNAIIVCPDYRLLPESSGLDILSDLCNFYTWLHTHLTSFLRTAFPLQTPTPDLANILVTGESAGGYMAVQSALLGETKGVKAVIAHYPMIDLKAAWYSKSGQKVIWGQSPPPEYPKGWLDEQLEAAKSAEAVTHRIPKETELDLFVALLLQGRYTELLGTDSRLYPLENLERMKGQGGKLPPMWVFHGDKDTIIPVDGTLKFLQETKGKVQGRVVKGQEHGFDNDQVGLDEDWVVEGRQWLKKYWP